MIASRRWPSTIGAPVSRAQCPDKSSPMAIAQVPFAKTTPYPRPVRTHHRMSHKSTSVKLNPRSFQTVTIGFTVFEVVNIPVWDDDQGHDGIPVPRLQSKAKG